MNKRAIEIKKEEFPCRNSAVAMTFEAEIKRLAIEKSLEMDTVVKLLAEKANVGSRHIYNYRSGKTDIPATLIPIFCKQFGSNVLAMAVVTACNETKFETGDLFDLGRFASRTVRNVLEAGDDFLEAFDDGRIDGHELSKLSLSTAKIVRDANRLLEIATVDHNRRMMPAAA